MKIFPKPGEILYISILSIATCNQLSFLPTNKTSTNKKKHLIFECCFFTYNVKYNIIYNIMQKQYCVEQYKYMHFDPQQNHYHLSLAAQLSYFLLPLEGIILK